MGRCIEARTTAGLRESTRELEGSSEELRRAQEAARQSEARLREVEARLARALVHTRTFVAEQDAGLRYTRVEPSSVAPEGLLGRTDSELLCAAEAVELVAAKRRVLATGVPVRLEVQMTLGGACRYYDLFVEPLRGSSGEIAGVSSVATDITERRRSEEERRLLDERVHEAQRIESLGMMAGRFAHDFNNLLMTILTSAEIALTDLTDVDPLHGDISRIQVAAQRASELCTQMLVFAGRGRHRPTTFDFTGMVGEMGRLLEMVIPPGVALRYDLAPGPLPVSADAVQIRQVVMNLITNAADAIGDKGGEVTLKTSLVEADAAMLARMRISDGLEPGHYVCCTVTDTGCGMDEATLSRMFDPFFTTKVKGRGLGLAAALGVLRRHKGAIQVDSRPGRGTTIRVLLPAAQATARVGQAA